MKNMKKYILLLCALSLGLVSCVKEDISGVDADGLVTFKAVNADASTRTVLDGLAPMWTPEDRISIYEGANNMFVNSLTAPAATAQFKGKLEGQGMQKGQFIAASPYSEAYSFSFVGNYVGGMTVPAQQTAVAGGYDPAAAPAVAFATSADLAFSNAYALVKFTIVSDGVKEVVFVGNDQEKIAGKMNVAMGDPLKMTVTQGLTEVTLKGDFRKDETYYISTIPADLATGFTMTLMSATGETVEALKYTSAIELERSAVLNVGDVSLVPSDSTLPDNPGDEDPEVQEETIYFQPSASWLADGARFAAYFWEDGVDPVWADLVADSVSGVFKCEVPAGYTNVIFTRMNPAVADNSWDNKWNQTADLKVPSDGNICFVPSGEDAEGKVTGTWTSYPPEVTESDPGEGDGTEGQVRIYLSNSWGWPYIWCWDSNGAQIFAGASWPGTNYHGEEDGYYYWNVPSEYVGKTVSLLAVKGDQSEQTSDFEGVVLDRSVYFYLEWTSELGCHLIQENK